jgi:hypothetical protein
LRKLRTREVGGVKMKKNEKKTRFAIYFSLVLFLAAHLALHFKDDL